MSVWASFILGGVAASVVWMPVVWLLLNQRDAARFESTYLRVPRPHPEVRRRLLYGDPLPTEWSGHVTEPGSSAWPPTGTTNWNSGTVTPTKES